MSSESPSPEHPQAQSAPDAATAAQAPFEASDPPAGQGPAADQAHAPPAQEPASAEHADAGHEQETAREEAAAASRILIGSQRAGQKRVQPKAKTPQPKPAPGAAVKLAKLEPDSGPPPSAKKYPPPNMRGQLTPELEVEFAEALGGMTVDEIIAGAESPPAEPELEPESRHRGRVISIHRENVFVDLGGRRQGVAPLKNFPEPPEPGAIVEVAVNRFDPAEGLYELGLPGGTVDVGDWSEVTEGMAVEARITGHNKGGLECEVNQLRGFIPASQVSLYRVENLAEFVGQKFACIVTEANAEKRNLVLSRRAVLEREKADAKEALLGQLEVGQLREGVVRSLQNFGAFVDLGGIDGLIHISQLSWDRVKHADEVLALGQKVKVKIQKIDPASGKIGLAFRDLLENPWDAAAQKYPSRSTVRGTVSRLMDFGAFVRLEPGVEGLVHISELSHKRVFRVADVVSEGQEVDALVLSVDPQQQRISLSLKALEAREAPARKETEPEEPEAAPSPASKRKTPLQGGLGQSSGGDRFGLKW